MVCLILSTLPPGLIPLSEKRTLRISASSKCGEGPWRVGPVLGTRDKCEVLVPFLI